MTRVVISLFALAVVAIGGGVRPAAAEELLSASDAIRHAIGARLGPSVEIAVTSVDVRGDAAVFREARLDPSARLGTPIRVTLITGQGAALPASAVVTVVGDYAVATRALARGEQVKADDIATVRGELPVAPLKRLPAADELVGAKVLRAVAAGAPMLAGVAAVRRAVEPGDSVTVVVASGAVEVSATFVAADGGDRGAVVRVVNPDTKRYLRGRVTAEGMVEVLDGR